MSRVPPAPQTTAMPARFLINVISLGFGAGFTLGIFLSIAHFLRAQESAAGTLVPPDDLAMVSLALPPPPPPPQAEKSPVDTPEFTDALALGLAEEPSSSPVTISPSPPSPDELLPMTQMPVRVVSGTINLESSIKPTLNFTLDQNHVYQRSEVDQPPVVLSRSDPPVPKSLLGDGQRRSVVILFVVDTRGAVGNVRVLRSSNNAEFDSIIAESVCEWRFSPAIRKGKSVRCMIQQQITVEMGRRDVFSL